MTENKNLPPSSLEKASIVGMHLTSTAAVVHEGNAGNWIHAPWIESMPGIDHSSSASGSYVIGMVGATLAERIAARLENKGKMKSAERARRFGNSLTVLSSIACQLAIETNPNYGISDKWDVISGIVSTAPGMIAGRYLGRVGAENNKTIKSA
jgi:hypothetical protein